MFLATNARVIYLKAIKPLLTKCSTARKAPEQKKDQKKTPQKLSLGEFDQSETHLRAGSQSNTIINEVVVVGVSQYQMSQWRLDQ
jgi:hypothetical protein